MDQINEVIKKFRKQKGFTQESISKKLFMDRSTYSKIESGATSLHYKTLLSISKVLEIPVQEIIAKGGDPVFDDIKDEFNLMLYVTEELLSQKLVCAIPFDELTETQVEFLQNKGKYNRAYYEKTPLGGRIYEFSPKDVFGFMVKNCRMDVLFKRDYVDDPLWVSRWNDLVRKDRPTNDSDFQYDENDYFLVYVVTFKMPDETEILAQIATSDFPEGMDEMDALNYSISKLGAMSGAILAFTFEGYASHMDVIRIDSDGVRLEECSNN